MGKGSQYCKFGQVKLNLKQKIYQALDKILGMMVQSEKNGAFDPDAVVVVALDPVPD